MGWARQAGIRRIVVNGSFVTDKQTPNDVDVIVLPGVDYPRDQQPASDEAVLWPFIQIIVAVDDADLEAWALKDFGTDRSLKPKGVVEVIL